MAFISSVGGNGNFGSNVPPISGSSPLRPQDGICLSPRAMAQGSTALTQAQLSLNMLYQQLFSGAQSQLIQNPQPTLLQNAQPQAQPQPQAFAVANPNQAALLPSQSLTLQQLFLHSNPLHQQIQALSQLLNPIMYYQQQLGSFFHSTAQPNTVQVQNGLSAPLQQQQQRIMETLVEQVAHNSTLERNNQQGPSRAASVERKVARMSSDQIQEHISDLIRKNTAILEDSPSQMKRRTYHQRQVGRQSSIEFQSDNQSQESSPGLRDARISVNRTQAFHDVTPHCSARAIQSGSLTNGQPVHRPLEKGFNCNYCQLTFLNETALDAHELRRCEASHVENSVHVSKSIAQVNDVIRSTTKSPHLHSSFENRHPLKRRLLAAVERSDEGVQVSSNKIAKLDLKTSIKGALLISTSICEVTTQKTLESTTSTYASTIYSIQQVPITTESISSKSLQVSQFQELISDGNKLCKHFLLVDTTERKGGRRPRPRSFTTDTFVCQKPRMNYFEAADSYSIYNHLTQSKVAEEEAKMNILFMGTCSTKPRMGVKPHCRYTVAEREMGAMKATHSSFWDFSTKIRLQQNAAVACAQMTNNSLLQSRKLDGLSAISPGTSTVTKLTNIASCAVTVSLGISQSTSNVLPIITKSEVEEESLEIRPDRVEDQAKVGESTGKSPEKLSIEKRIFDEEKTSEVNIYVKGRGRGRYVCERCGIRCKKPSMLKKHLKSHTDIRPYECVFCNFSFKTKGNLTKHELSKSHLRRISSVGQSKMDIEENKEYDGEPRLEIVSPSEVRCARAYSILEQDLSSSDEEEHALNPDASLKVWPSSCKFGQENILIERTAHTPPSFWLMRGFNSTKSKEGEDDEKRKRICYSAPPAVNINLKEEMDDDADLSREKQLIVYQNQNVKTMSIPSESETYCHSNSVAQTSLGAFLTKEELTCDMCHRVFRRATELALHRHTHSIEQQNSRTRTFHCEECRQSFRSKSLLNRHTEMLHCNVKRRRNQNDETAPADPRSFRCTDCDIGFRKHGILSKHLRSKGHVAKLESQGKLPEDALSLISSDLSLLNQIDTKDCETALCSLLGILNTLRDSTSLECREQLLQSPAPPSTNRYTFMSRKRSAQSFPSNSARRASINSSARQQRDENFSTVQADTSVPVLRKAYEEISEKNDVEVKSVSANLWMPPKLEFSMNNAPLEKRTSDFSHATRTVIDSSALSDNVVLGSSVRSDEANSEGAGRSESSTPTQKLINGTAPSPLLPSSTRCNVCDFTYETGFDLQVHLHTDHVTLRDGNDFRCPTKRCDKVYPTRESLRAHIAGHFCENAVTSVRDSHDENDNVTSILTESNATNQSAHRKLATINSNTEHNNSSTLPNNVSPGIPEESQTISLPKSSESYENGEVEIIREVSTDSSGNKWLKDDSAGSSFQVTKRTVNREVKVDNVQRNKSTSVEESCSSKQTPQGFLPCAICESSFPDALTLQKHWLSHVCYRPHICKQCDAGFTTADALNAHAATHGYATR